MSATPPDDPGTWTAVPAEPPEDRPSSPPWQRFLGPGVAAALVLTGGIIGASMGGGATPDPTPEPSPSPALSMEPPVQVADFVRGDVTESNGPAPENQRIVRADYSDGADTLIFVMTWPEDELSAYMADAGVENAREVQPGTLCGTSVDTGLAACGQITEDTGLLLLAVTEQPESTVLRTLGEFDEAVTG